MRKIPLKNYFILALVVILSGIIVYFLGNFYIDKKKYDEKENHVLSFLKEIYVEDFENFIIENPDTIIYINRSDNSKNKKIEKKLKKDIIKRNYEQDIIYIDSTDITGDFINILNNYIENKLSILPNVIIVKDGKISNVMYINSNTKSTEIIDFMEMYYND